MTTIRQGDTGTVIKGTLVDEDDAAIDVSTASTKEIIVRTPTGLDIRKTASFTTDGTDGVLQFTTAATDFALTGTYSIQLHVVIGSNSWYSSTKRITVTDAFTA